MNAATKKQKFVSSLKGPKAYGERLTDLQEELEEIEYQMLQTIKESYANDPSLKNLTEDQIWREKHIAPSQLTIMFVTSCPVSPYARHAYHDAQQFKCHWCKSSINDFE